MTRLASAVFAALEALVIPVVGMLVVLLPLLVVWGVHEGFSVSPAVFWHIAVDLWLIAHGITLHATIGTTLLAQLGLGGGTVHAALSLAPLGLTAITVVLGARLGRRAAMSDAPAPGILAATVAFAVLSGVLSLTAQTGAVSSPLWEGFLFPALVFLASVVLGVLVRAVSAEDRGTEELRAAVGGLLDRGPAWLEPVLRLGGGAATATLLGLVAVSSVLVTLALVIRYAEVTSLYEALHASALGGAVITWGQFALLPDLVVWALSWMAGPGFALGTGSAISPLGAQVGPLPSLPVFGALPSGSLGFAFVVVVIPVLIAFLVTLRLRPALARATGGIRPVVWSAAWPVALAVVVGLVVALLCWFASGALAPGRLETVGPFLWPVAAAIAVETALGGLLGSFVGMRSIGVAEAPSWLPRADPEDGPTDERAERTARPDTAWPGHLDDTAEFDEGGADPAWHTDLRESADADARDTAPTTPSNTDAWSETSSSETPSSETSSSETLSTETSSTDDWSGDWSADPRAR